MSRDRRHDHAAAGNGGKNLIVALLLNVGITVAQVVGGLI